MYITPERKRSGVIFCFHAKSKQIQQAIDTYNGVKTVEEVDDLQLRALLEKESQKNAEKQDAGIAGMERIGYNEDSVGSALKGAGGTEKYYRDEQLETEPNTAYFWSGKSNGVGGKDFAMNHAAKNGGTTLEGLMKSQGINMPTWDISDPVSIKAWDDASATYARQVSGEIRAIIGSRLRPNNVWQTIELPRLMNNTNVTKIITIDPETLAEKVVLWR